MNINNIPEPVIKPTKEPKIMVDANKNAFEYSGPLLHEAPPTSDESAPSFTSHETVQTSPAIDVIKALFMPPKDDDITSRTNVTMDQVKLFKSFVWLFVVIGFILPLAMSAFRGLDESTNTPTSTNTPQQDENSSVVTTYTQIYPDKNDRFHTSCFSIVLPSSSYALESDGCVISFTGGNTTLFSNPKYDSGFAYGTPQDFINILGDYYIKTIKVDGYDVIISRYETVDAISYHFWVNDLKLKDEYGQRIATITFDQYNAPGVTEKEQLDRIRSVKLHLEEVFES